ncbi:MAG TPA: class I SAM-dependent methyltransferase [Dissulfurispiraceae bacterium]|nr:class I SAM-dependent methyltransferase [Dissulfurispiraceae bacterium]
MSQRERYEQGGIGRWYWDYRDRAIMAFMPAGKILDVGCGEMITTRKIGAIGMDIDNGDVRGSVYDIPFEDKSFDAVLFSEVIEHLSRPFAALREINRVLKHSGRVVVVFPNDLTFKVAWFLTGKWGEISQDRGHLQQWTPKRVCSILRRSWFNVLTQRSIPFKFWPFSLHHIIVGVKC